MFTSQCCLVLDIFFSFGFSFEIFLRSIKAYGSTPMDLALDVIPKINFYIDKTSNFEDFLQTLQPNQIEDGFRSMYLTHN
jgi:hypothetical protein